MRDHSLNKLHVDILVGAGREGLPCCVGRIRSFWSSKLRACVRLTDFTFLEKVFSNPPLFASGGGAHIILTMHIPSCTCPSLRAIQRVSRGIRMRTQYQTDFDPPCFVLAGPLPSRDSLAGPLVLNSRLVSNREGSFCYTSCN